MDPILAAIISKPTYEVIKFIGLDKIVADISKEWAKPYVKHLKPDAATKACTLFINEFLIELDIDSPQAEGGYRDQFEILFKNPDTIFHLAAPLETLSNKPGETISLNPIRDLWTALHLASLPDDFDWTRLAANYARAITKLIKKDETFRAQLQLALEERQADDIRRLAGPDPGFNLTDYRKFLEKKCSALQLASLHTSTYSYDRQVKLWNLFIPQNAREAVPVRDIPRAILKKLKAEGHVKEDEQPEDELAELRDSYQNQSTRPVLEILGDNPRLVILGDPGSGKTSLLKYLALRWVNAENGEKPQGPLPLWIELKEYVALGQKGFLRFLQDSCTTYQLRADELERKLQSGDAALYLDGLDEVFDPQARGAIIAEIIAFRYANAPVVVTSRIVGYEAGPLREAGFSHATLEDFDETQVSDFLAAWHRLAFDDDLQDGQTKQDRLQRAIGESAAIRELAGNPLLLTMMAILNRNQDLPRDRVELYKECSRVLLHEWDASRFLPVDQFGRQEKESLLREIAWEMQSSEAGLKGNLIERDRLLKVMVPFLKELGIPSPYDRANEVIRSLVERNFILCYAGADRFAFVHRTFLEYFCASGIVERYRVQRSLSFQDLQANFFNARWREESWHEVLRLVVGLISDNLADAERLIRALMPQPDQTEFLRESQKQKFANWFLAAGCLSEVRNRAGILALDEELREVFQAHVIRWQPDHYYEDYEEWSLCAETRQRALHRCEFVWHDDRTKAWLMRSAESDADWIVREAAVQELARGWKSDPDTLHLLKDRARNDDHSYVRQAAVQELARGWNSDADTLPWLKDRARNDSNYDVRVAAVQELARGWKSDPDTLPLLKDRARNDDHFPVRTAAVQELARGWKSDPDTLPLLKDRALNDNHSAVRMAAVKELARGWKSDPDTLPLLKDRARNDNHSDVRMAAVQELARGWKSDPDTLPLLKDRTRNDDHYDVRRAAVQELARGWKSDPDTLPSLKDRALNDSDNYVRRAAVQELARGWKSDPDTLPLLKDRARNDNHSAVRMAAVQELARGWMSDADTLPLLKDRARNDSDNAVRSTAVQELARGWKSDRDTLPLLKQLILRAEPDSWQRFELIATLRQRWHDNQEVTDFLRTLEPEQPTEESV